MTVIVRPRPVRIFVRAERAALDGANDNYLSIRNRTLVLEKRAKQGKMSETQFALPGSDAQIVDSAISPREWS